MVRCIVMSLGMLLLLPVPKDDEAKKDRARLQGTWKCVYSETDGEGFEPINDTFLTFEKDTFAEKSSVDVASRGTFRLDPSRRPKAIDFTLTENKLFPDTKGMRIYCIYELTANRLKIRTPTAGFPKWRPKEFGTKKGSTGNPLLDIAQGGTLEIYKKVKP